MYFQRFSSILLLLLTTLPTSLTAPPMNGVSVEAMIECYQRPDGRRCITPFPSNCRTLANRIRSFPNAGTVMVFDRRVQDPTVPHIPVPFEGEYGTCKVKFVPYQLDPSSRPGSNFAAYATFAAAIDHMAEICFTAGPGQERVEHSLAIAKFDHDVVPLGTGKWLGAMFGFNLPGSANVTDDGDGFACGEIVESLASGNGSMNGLVNGGSGTGEQERVDVT